MVINKKGVLDLDTVKGCACGLKAHPDGGCYGLCYACKVATRYKYDFTKAVSRLASPKELSNIRIKIERASEKFVRIGTMGDPCHDWKWTIDVCRGIVGSKPIIIVTKHWIALEDYQMEDLGQLDVIINTSISALDTAEERKHRLIQYNRYKKFGKSVLRIVSCKFNTDTLEGAQLNNIQEELFKNDHVIDNPLRISKGYYLYKNGVIIACDRDESIGGSLVSLNNPMTYLGTCRDCPELCGISFFDENL